MGAVDGAAELDCIRLRPIGSTESMMLYGIPARKPNSQWSDLGSTSSRVGEHPAISFVLSGRLIATAWTIYDD